MYFISYVNSYYIIFLIYRLDISVRAIFDLWFDGDPSKNYQPFRKMHSYDLSIKSSKVALSKASGVISKLLEFGNTSEDEVIATKSFAERDHLFERCLLNMFHSLYPEDDVAAFDRRRIGDLTYTHVYDLLHPKVNPPAKRRRHADENDKLE